MYSYSFEVTINVFVDFDDFVEHDRKLRLEDLPRVFNSENK